jgi:hypothetical protein
MRTGNPRLADLITVPSGGETDKYTQSKRLISVRPSAG